MPSDSQEVFAQIDEVNRAFRRFCEEASRPKPAPILYVKLLSNSARVPTKGSDQAIGWDLYGVGKEIIIQPHRRIGISTNIAIAVPKGYYGRIAPRSGLALRSGIDVLGGVVDSDYRGEIMVILHNTTDDPVIVDLSLPIAQLILERADIPTIMVVSNLDTTARGEKGFGSSDGK